MTQSLHGDSRVGVFMLDRGLSSDERHLAEVGIACGEGDALQSVRHVDELKKGGGGRYVRTARRPEVRLEGEV